MPQVSLREMQAQLSRLETSHKLLVTDVASIKTIVNGLSSHFDSSIKKLHDLILSHILGKQVLVYIFFCNQFTLYYCMVLILFIAYLIIFQGDNERRSKAKHDIGEEEEEEEEEDDDKDEDEDDDKDEDEDDDKDDGFNPDEDVDDDPVGEDDEDADGDLTGQDKDSKDREKEDNTCIECPSGVKDVSSGHNEDDNVSVMFLK